VFIALLAFGLWFVTLQIFKPYFLKYIPDNEDLKDAYFYLWVIIYSYFTIIMDERLRPLIDYLVEWENNKYQDQKELSLALKLFFLKFINSYLGCSFSIFWNGDYAGLNRLL
jgi:hypothetical protein